MARHIILVGGSGVGKTTYIRRLQGQAFEKRYIATNETRRYELNGMDIVDTMGQEPQMGNAYEYQAADVVVIMYDVTSLQSFKLAQAWVLEAKKYVRTTTQIVLVANKVDLVMRRKVSSEMGRNYAMENGVRYDEVSVKTATNLRFI